MESIVGDVLKLLYTIEVNGNLYSLAEGLPYECEDEGEMVDNITKIKDGAAGVFICAVIMSTVFKKNARVL